MTVGESPDAWRDHPRVCGEHQNVRFSDDWDGGSSPRMRGTLRRAFRKFRRLGIIPAYAGNTQPVSPCRQCNRDHPRVCGEHDPLVPSVCDVLGSSPRMRGTLGRRVVGLCLVGIIPAYAGNTTARNASTKAKRDHPRVCGEHRPEHHIVPVLRGSSPRMRGTLQPHAGKVGKRGIIPAYAGNTSTDTTYSSPDRDHPRVCGEHIRNAAQSAARGGDHPRVCGEHAHSIVCVPLTAGSSPRMRGIPRERRRTF